MTEQIGKRRSVRRYEDAPLPAEAQSALACWRDWTRPLGMAGKIDCGLELLPEDAQLRGLFKVRAPRYLVFTSQHAPLFRMNAGFMLEQVSLRLSALGVGSCYLGGSHVDAARCGLRLPPVIVMSCGLPGEALHREATGFRRREFESVCPGGAEGDMHAIVESARLAPSAMNRQPWLFKVQGGAVHCYGDQPALGMLRQFGELDMGIALSHMWLTACGMGAQPAIAREDDVPAAPRGMQYMATLRID